MVETEDKKLNIPFQRMNQDMLYDYERHGLFQNFPPEIWLILRATRLFFESCFESWNEN